MGFDSIRAWKEFGGEVGIHCRDCEERYVGCHSTCEKYIEAKKKHDDFVENAKQNKAKSDLLYIHKLGSIRKELKNRKG